MTHAPTRTADDTAPTHTPSHPREIHAAAEALAREAALGTDRADYPEVRPPAPIERSGQRRGPSAEWRLG